MKLLVCAEWTLSPILTCKKGVGKDLFLPTQHLSLLSCIYFVGMSFYANEQEISLINFMFFVVHKNGTRIGAKWNTPSVAFFYCRCALV